MSITIPFAGANIKVPGAYSTLRTNLTGSLPLTPTGIVGIIGEATKGAPGSDTLNGGVKEYDSATLADLISYFGSGPIVDAARTLVNASNDSRILQGASRIFVYKTNSSTAASLVINQNVSNPYATLNSRNWGVDENLINTTISQDTPEVFSLQFGVDWSGTPAADITLRVNGGTVVTITAANCTTAALTVTELNTKLNTALGTVAIAYASNVANRISINLAITGTGAKRNGMGISLEFIASANWVTLGVTVPQQGVAIVAGSGVNGLTATNPTRTITVNRQQDQITETTSNTTGELGGKIYLEIGCSATTSTLLTISNTTLTTVVTGSGASSLSLTLVNFATLADLAQYINAQPGYSCVVPSNINPGLPPSVLDRVTSVGIDSSTVGIRAGQVKADSYEIQKWFDNNSSLVSVTRTLFVGLPDVLALSYLNGGTRGSSSTSSFNNGFTAFEGKRINIVVPLVSQDASDDLVELPGYTDTSSTYDAESILIQAREHCKKMSNVVNRNERNCYLGYRETFQNCRNESKIIDSEFCSLSFQDVQLIGTDGALFWGQPHLLACLIAGLQAGAEIGLPATFKFVAANGIRHVKKQGVAPLSTELFDPNNPGSKNLAIEDGLLILESPSSGGIRVVLQNSTYQNDANFVFNRPSVLAAAHYIAYNLRNQLEALFVGDKVRTGTAESIRNAVIAVMKQFLDAEIIVGDDTNGNLGYKNLAVHVNGSVATIDICITPVVGVDFVLARITLDSIRQSA